MTKKLVRYESQVSPQFILATGCLQVSSLLLFKEHIDIIVVFLLINYKSNNTRLGLSHVRSYSPSSFTFDFNSCHHNVIKLFNGHESLSEVVKTWRKKTLGFPEGRLPITKKCASLKATLSMPRLLLSSGDLCLEASCKSQCQYQWRHPENDN